MSAAELEASVECARYHRRDVGCLRSRCSVREGVTVSHAAAVGTWFIRGDYNARSAVANSTERGSARYSAIELIQDSLNLKTPTVYDADANADSTIINPRRRETS